MKELFRHCLKKIYVICFFISFLFFSCSESETTIFEKGIEVETLKKSILNQSEQIQWLEPLEKNLLQDKKEEYSDRIEDKEFATSIGATVLAPLEGEIIYPEIKGFGSIDISKMNSEVKKISENFAENIMAFQKTPADEKYLDKLYALMVTDKKYIMSVFLYDVENLSVTFDSFILGQEHLGENFTQVPIRFYSEKTYFDVHLYIVKSNGWKIEQIRYGGLENE